MADQPTTVKQLVESGPGTVTTTVGSAAIISAIVSLATMYAHGTIDVQSASAAVGVIFAAINSFFSHSK